MVSASLSSLPPELLCQIFEYADNFSVVAALSRTARIFYNTWRTHPTSICQAVAPRVISNFADAAQLLDMQEESEASKQDCCDFDKAIFRVKRLLSNDRRASDACASWVIIEKDLRWWTKRRLNLRRSERVRFKHAFYCLWTFVVMSNARHMQEQASAFLERGGPRELFILEQMSTWVRNYGGPDYETWSPCLDLVYERWQSYVSYPWIPGDVWVFFNRTQEEFFKTVPAHWPTGE